MMGNIIFEIAQCITSNIYKLHECIVCTVFLFLEEEKG